MKDIAIIGIAGRFPEADDLKAFRHNLVAGKDCVRPFSFERKSATTLALDKEFMEIGYMEDIDKFDHRFFNISKAEAEYMDPHQRILMEVVYETIESAGYNVDFFNGSETAVFIGDTEQKYGRLADRFDPTLLTGTTDATTAGRIARFFNLRGNAAMVDTACSSSLLAIHMACNELLIGDADYALAAGVRFILFPAEKNTGADLGIMSKDGRTRSFSAKAEGSGAGEAVGCVLLKPLDKAIADKDIVYAVIKGTAANQDAQLSGSLTAPSSQAQAEVIRKTWSKGGIDPTTVSYIEAHGSGTKLGDPIEIAGMDLAFKDLTDKKHFCAVSSIKSNIGHTGSAAGISGLIKAVLSLQHKELYPSVHFDQPNPFIAFKQSATYVNAAYKAWEAPYPRRAGVSSFGLSGTNCHVLLEETPQVAETAPVQGSFLFNFSARTEASLDAYLDRFATYLSALENPAMANISYTLNAGRKHYQHRVSLIAATKEELLQKIKGSRMGAHQEAVKKIIFLFSGDALVSDDFLRTMTKELPELSKYTEACAAYYDKSGAAINRFVLQYALYHYWEEKGLTTEHLLGIGSGDLVVAVALKEMSLEEAMAQCAAEETIDPDLDQKLRRLIARETEEGRALFIELGPEACLSKGLRTLNYPDQEALYGVVSIKQSPLEIIEALYLAQYSIDWEKYYHAADHRKVSLPAYPFEKVRCWLKEPLRQEDFSVANSNEDKAALPDPIAQTAQEPGSEHLKAIVQDSWSAMEQKIAGIWINVLKLEALTLDDDFFRLGGHSLMATKVIATIEKGFGIKLVFKDIFTLATVRSLAKGVEGLLASGDQQAVYQAIVPAPIQDDYPLSEAQLRLWLIHQSNERSVAYNLPTVLLLEGKLDIPRLERAFSALCERHESLRTSFHERNAQPVQVIHPAIDFSIQELVADRDPASLLRTFLRPFDLRQPPLLRVGLAEQETDKHLLFFDMHHIISDGVSLAVLISELVKLYHGETLEPLAIQYKDFVLWQQGLFDSGLMQQQENFWLQQFPDQPPVLQLRTDQPRPAIQSFEGDKLLFDLSGDQVQQIQAMAATTGTTPFMVLLAVFKVLLHKYTGQEDIVIGSPIAGRAHNDLDKVIGMFVNTLLLRTRPAREKTFIQFLQEVKEHTLNAYDNQDYPFALLVDKLNGKKDPSRNPLFDVIFVLQNLKMPKMQLEDIAVSPYPIHTGTAQFDLIMEISEGKDRWPVKLEYNTALFEEETLLLMKERFLALLQDILGNPEKSIQQLSFKIAAEVLEDNNDLDFAFNF
ncbi:condensation domain-containing protein [Taibaiella koreensis]|uniref:condensation domain-containing protein n=1 Tax=Taibaiella koreensis TaxID=1268548 RepID=UPI000E59D6F7|nr:condensation domain-containing protein [Taibaiella koreensis]